MSAATNIEWTDRTWNPTRGCSRVGAGCYHCYAIRQARRADRPGGAYEGLTRVRSDGSLDWSGVVRFVPEKLDEPLRWREPSRVFVNSMSDLFHESLPNEAIDQVYARMLLAPRHTFQILTKRPDRQREYLSDPGLYERLLAVCDVIRSDRPELMEIGVSNPTVHPPKWIQNGVSVEDQNTADERIPILLRTPAAVRFVSYEPALGPVDFDPLWLRPTPTTAFLDGRVRVGDLLSLGCVGLDWLIVGGESGPGARPCDVAWIRRAVEQCRAAGVPVFVKQLGSVPVDRQPAFGDDARGWRDMDLTEAMTQPRPPQMEGWTRIRTETACFWQRRIHIEDRKGGDQNEWPEDLRIREFPR